MKLRVKHLLVSTCHGVDRYKMNVNFRENNKEQLSTCFGTILSLLILVIVLFHSKNKLEVLVNHEDYRY